MADRKERWSDDEVLLWVPAQRSWPLLGESSDAIADHLLRVWLLQGVVLVYKIAGALAATGADLDACYDVAKFVMDSTATLGMGLDHCHVRFLRC